MSNALPISNQPATQVVEYNDPASLEGLRLLWTRLLAETPDATFFQTLDWLLVYWKHFGDSNRLRVLVVYAAGKPLGILPLVVRTERRGPAAIRTLTYPLDHWGTHYGPIGPNPAATLHLAMAYLAAAPRDWDCIDLPWVDVDRERVRTTSACSSAGLPCESNAHEEVAFLDLDGDWQQYLASRGHKFRVNLRRSERQLAEQGEVRFERHRPAPASEGDGDPRWDLYDACEQIAAHSWQGSAEDGNTLSHPRVRAFLRDVHEVAARLGAVDMSVLYLNDQPVAFIYNYCWRGNLFGLRRGHDATITQAGAGSVVLARVVEDSFARGDRVFNLGAGYLAAKRYWLTRIEVTSRVAHYPATNLKAQAIRLARYFRRERNENSAKAAL